MHLQFADWRRLLAKHVWYRMMEQVEYPGRSTVDQLNAKYENALDEAQLQRSPVPARWWAGHDKASIDMKQQPWHEAECRRMLKEHGRKHFSGLKLFGIV